ncbi:hypothetical protein GWK48_09515 [Metallosphaera tengchongensis]|uniref:Uncharacterized protein n=1 Tax=Metallosphaera tengchongensis TaxID=1532350 RepID=A0A6N0NUW8_9CREN|nr:hypothetical protein [Metallosphaera tengchongensis]QKR00586.1 hypothetical protein GWK48_09515 [Metallosphaera tengchongensis]
MFSHKFSDKVGGKRNQMRDFMGNVRTLMNKGFHPTVIMNGCMRRGLQGSADVSSDGSLGGSISLEKCLILGHEKEGPCNFYPSTKRTLLKKELRTEPGQGRLILGADGMPFVDILRPERNSELLKAYLSTSIGIHSPTWYGVEQHDVAGFFWGFRDSPPLRVEQGMATGLINRPGGLVPVKALYRALNGAEEYFERRGFPLRDLIKLSEETLERAGKALVFDSDVRAFNLTRAGIHGLQDVVMTLGFDMEVELPDPWYPNLWESTKAFGEVTHSEVLVLVIGREYDVDSALSKAESIGIPSFNVGKIKDKGKNVFLKKRKV